MEERQGLPSAIAQYVLYLKFGRQLSKLDYKVDGVNYSHTYPYVNPRSPRDPAVEAGPKIALAIQAQPIPPGPVTIHIKAPYANSTADPLEIVYRFYHQPL